MDYQWKSLLLPPIYEAGRRVLNAHDAEREDRVTVKPGDANFVTVYDVMIQEYLLGELAAKFPGACFVAEEQENDPTVLAAEVCFVVDPIDGTSNFMHDFRHSAISVGMLSHGELVAGAVYDPYLNEMFYAERGRGAVLNDRPISVINRPASRALVSYGTALYYKDRLGDATFGIAKELFYAFADVRRGGSAALDLAYVAAGRSDLFFECLLSPWDIAAGALLITEAGGVITDMRGEPLSLQKPSSVIAGAPELYPTLLKITEKYC
ncbi:MAG: inositol monophosphatase [Ruminococcaceae bacterium]|nr:inositol monophosphatase [Oscillospiraceae bacterium]